LGISPEREKRKTNFERRTQKKEEKINLAV